MADFTGTPFGEFLFGTDERTICSASAVTIISMAKAATT